MILMMITTTASTNMMIADTIMIKTIPDLLLLPAVSGVVEGKISM